MEKISEKAEKSVKKEKQPEKKQSKAQKAAEDFKRKYFEYYDDIKIGNDFSILSCQRQKLKRKGSNPLSYGGVAQLVRASA